MERPACHYRVVLEVKSQSARKRKNEATYYLWSWRDDTIVSQSSAFIRV